MQDMYAVFEQDQLVNPGMLEGVFDRAVLKAMNQAKKLGEV
jgi:hypothetical protein